MDEELQKLRKKEDDKLNYLQNFMYDNYPNFKTYENKCNEINSIGTEVIMMNEEGMRMNHTINNQINERQETNMK